MIKEATLTAQQKKLLDGWLELLRSGKYSQAREVLKMEEGHCCLGIAAEFILEIPYRHQESDGFVFQGVDGSYSVYALLDDRQASFMGLNKELTQFETSYFYDKNGSVPDTRQIALAHMNDKGYSFADIADTVEELGWNV